MTVGRSPRSLAFCTICSASYFDCPYPRYGSYGESSVNTSSGVGFTPNGELDETCTKRAAPDRRARSTTFCVPPTLTSKNSRVDEVGWMTAAAWNTAAPGPTPSNRRSAVSGARTSPTTTSTVGDSSARGAAWSSTGTRQRTRSRCPTRARTRFWPSHPEAPVTTAVAAGSDVGTSEEGSISVTGTCRGSEGAGITTRGSRRRASRLGQELVAVAGGDGHDGGLGVDAGGVGDQRPVVDPQVSQAPHPAEAVR